MESRIPEKKKPETYSRRKEIVIKRKWLERREIFFTKLKDSEIDQDLKKPGKNPPKRMPQ